MIRNFNFKVVTLPHNPFALVKQRKVFYLRRHVSRSLSGQPTSYVSQVSRGIIKGTKNSSLFQVQQKQRCNTKTFLLSPFALINCRQDVLFTDVLRLLALESGISVNN